MHATTFVVIMFSFFVVFIGLAYRYHVREMDHKQTLAAIEKGVVPPAPQSAPWTPRTYLLHGMIWLFAGLASFVALSAVAVTSHHPVTMEARLAAVTNARSLGATPAELDMLLHAPHQDEGIPIGLGCLGLIPVGVGLAYLIFYKIESKKLLS